MGGGLYVEGGRRWIPVQESFPLWGAPFLRLLMEKFRERQLLILKSKRKRRRGRRAGGGQEAKFLPRFGFHRCFKFKWINVPKKLMSTFFKNFIFFLLHAYFSKPPPAPLPPPSPCIFISSNFLPPFEWEGGERGPSPNDRSGERRAKKSFLPSSLSFPFLLLSPLRERKIGLSLLFLSGQIPGTRGNCAGEISPSY